VSEIHWVHASIENSRNNLFLRKKKVKQGLLIEV
jgi:hypothetical protein